MLASGLIFVAGTVGLVLLPLSVACIRKNILVSAAIIFVVLCLVLSGYYLYRYYRGEEVLDLPLQGAFWDPDNTEELVPGYEEASIPKWVNWTAIGIGMGSFSSLLATQLRRWPLAGEAFLIWSCIGHFLLMAILWLFYDRCVLVLVPSAIALLLASKPALRRGVALPFLALFGVVSLVVVRDHLEYNSALWKAVQELRDMGVPDSEFDGGYVVNGWLQYAHAENTRRNKEGYLMIPMLGFDPEPELRYQISDDIGENHQLVKSIPYKRWLGRSGRLTRGPPESAATPATKRKSKTDLDLGLLSPPAFGSGGGCRELVA